MTDFSFTLEDDPDDKDDEGWEFDCHMDQSGLCGKAGSEECDFECPYNEG